MSGGLMPTPVRLTSHVARVKAGGMHALNVAHCLCPAVLLILSAVALCQPPSTRTPPPQTPGPWNNDLWTAEAREGLRFGMPRHFQAAAGVPSLLNDGKGKILAAFQWFHRDRRETFDRIAVRMSIDNGRTWSDPVPIHVKGLPDGFIRPCDPTLALLPDGRIRLYFTSHARGVRSPATYSAVSSDGIMYAFEPGTRFTVEGEPILDCAVARLGKTWHYYAPVQGGEGRAYHAQSVDGLTFKRLADVEIAGRGSWLGAVVSMPRGLRFYGTGRNVWSAESLDGAKWEMNHGERTLGHDPGVARTADGRWLIVTTGPPAAQGILQLIPDTPPPPPFP